MVALWLPFSCSEVCFAARIAARGFPEVLKSAVPLCAAAKNELTSFGSAFAHVFQNSLAAERASGGALMGGTL